MDYMELTADQCNFFDANGYLIVPGALSTETLAAVTEAADAIMEHHEYEGYYQHCRAGLMRSPVLAQLATNSPTLSLAVQILGTHIHITNTALIYKHPQPHEEAQTGSGHSAVKTETAPPPGKPTWHRDVGVHLDVGHVKLPRVGLKMAFCLTDMDGPNTGATLFAPGSNLQPEPLLVPEGGAHPENYVEPRLKAGDAYLFESRTYHDAAINISDRTAKIAMFGYHYIWVKPDHYLFFYDGEPQPSATVLKGIDDVGRQLLCAGEDSKGRKDPNGIDWPIAEWCEQLGLSLPRAPQLRDTACSKLARPNGSS